MLFDHLRNWQIALSVLWLSLVLGGIAGFFRRPRGSRVPFRTRALVSSIAIATGLFGWWLTRDLLRPAAHPLAPPPTVVDERQFDSRDDPAVHIDVPAGWRLSLDEKSRAVRVAPSDDAADPPRVALQIESARLENEVDTERLLRGIEPKLTEAGFKVDPIVQTTIGSLPAQAITGRIRDRALTTWLVKRSAHYVTTLHCATTNDSDSSAACMPVLEKLSWLAPAYP